MTLEPGWKGPHTIILTISTVVKVDRVPTWIHHLHMKLIDPPADPEDCAPEEVNPRIWRAIGTPTRPSKSENLESHPSSLMMASFLCFLSTYLLGLSSQVTMGEHNPHIPFNLTWKVINADSGKVLNQTPYATILGT